MNNILEMAKKPAIAVALLLAVALTAHAGDIVIESGNLKADGTLTAETAFRQNVFRVTGGGHSINSTSWIGLATASGTATITGPFCYALQTDGMWVDTSGHRIYLRLAFTPSGGGTTTYLPDSGGHKKYYYIDHTRLDAWTNIYCSSDLAAGDYDVVLQWRGENTDNTIWNSTYGFLNLAIW